MYTYQDFEKDVAGGIPSAVGKVIATHRGTAEYLEAVRADLYDRQKNPVVREYARYLYVQSGVKIVDDTAANNKIASNFFNRLNTQRVTYSLGNGVNFSKEGLKERLGVDFDTKLQTAGYYALIHSCAFLFWNVDHVHVFPLTEFAPLYDETTGALRAGVRFWSIDSKKPMMAVLYEEDGYTEFKGEANGGGFIVTREKTSYRKAFRKAKVDPEPEIIGEENYTSLPIIPLWGNRIHQSTLVGLEPYLNSYDLVLSGFANDLEECAEIYWIVSNAGGMTDGDLKRFRDKLRFQHIAAVMDADATPIQPYTQEVPTAARHTFLAEIRASMYEAFGALDVHVISAGATNDHIDAAYQPLDENADDFEYQIIDAVQHLLLLLDEEDTPIFKRNRISNQREQADIVLKIADHIDEETLLKKYPIFTPDEIQGIMDAKARQDEERLLQMQTLQQAQMGLGDGING